MPSCQCTCLKLEKKRIFCKKIEILFLEWFMIWHVVCFCNASEMKECDIWNEVFAHFKKDVHVYEIGNVWSFFLEQGVSSTSSFVKLVMSRNALTWTNVIMILNRQLYLNVYVTYYCPLLALYAYELFWECFIKVGYIQYVNVSMSICQCAC